MKSRFSTNLYAINLCIAVYIGLALNFVNLWRNTDSTPSDFAIMALSGITMSAAVYLLLSVCSLAGQITYKSIASLLLFCSAAASYYMIFFNVIIGYGVIVSVLTTDIDLSVESVGYKFALWLMATGILPIILLWKISITRPCFRQYPRLMRTLSSMTAGIVAYIVIAVSVHNIDSITKRQAEKQNTYTASPGGILAHTYLPTNWISALALYAWEKGYGNESLENRFDPAKHFTYNETTPLDDTLVVFIIGETTRADHMGILGYDRDTTPLLEKEKNLVILRGVSCDTATKLSLKCMFVRKNGTANNEQRTLREYNIFAVLHELGFKSQLFAMQSELWFYNSIRTDSYKFREILAAQSTSKHKRLDDMLLADELGKTLKKHPHGKRLIILHMKGSHYLYSERYPREFARYTPECKSIDDNCTHEQMVNAYDNSVLYIDTILARIIDEVRNRKAIVFFSSDHGESINENEHFHATPRRVAPPEQFRVPVMVWTSDAFLNSSPAHAEAFKNLQALQQRNAIVSHTSIFDTLLGCLGYQSPDGGIDERNDLCSKDYTGFPIKFPLAGAYTTSHFDRISQQSDAPPSIIR